MQLARFLVGFRTPKNILNAYTICIGEGFHESNHSLS